MKVFDGFLIDCSFDFRLGIAFGLVIIFTVLYKLSII